MWSKRKQVPIIIWHALSPGRFFFCLEETRLCKPNAERQARPDAMLRHSQSYLKIVQAKCRASSSPRRHAEAQPILFKDGAETDTETSADCLVRRFFSRWCDRNFFLSRQKKISVAPAQKRLSTQAVAIGATHLHVGQPYSKLHP